jgi:tetratricopeptide (TPR) repeat protein
LIFLNSSNKGKIYLALAGLCLLVYANSLFGAFVYDDVPVILKGTLISKPGHFLLEPTDLSYTLNYLIAKDNPFSYHLTNLILHALNTILVFVFLEIFFNTESSFLGAILFAVHPIHVEAVAWITARVYLFTALFILLTYILYNKATNTFNNKNQSFPSIDIRKYLLCLLIFSYYIIRNYYFYFLIPFFLILSDIIFNRWRRNWKWWIPFVVITLIRLILLQNTISARVYTAARELGSEVSLRNPIPALIYSLFFHFGLLVWPGRLTLYHQPILFLWPIITLGAVVLVAIICTAFLKFRKAKEIFFALSLFILFLAPTYSPITISTLVAERYAYFPSIALSIFVAFFYNHYASKSNALKRNFLFLLFFIIVVYSVRSIIRNEDWKSQSRLWRATLLASPNSAWARINMGYVYQQEGNIEAAIREYNKAISLKPNFLEAYNNLGTAYQLIGKPQEAIAVYNKILEIDPKFVKVYNNLGVIYNELGNLEEAIAVYKKAIEIAPGYAYAYYNLSRIYERIGKPKESIAAYKKAVEINPGFKNIKSIPAEIDKK